VTNGSLPSCSDLFLSRRTTQRRCRCTDPPKLPNCIRNSKAMAFGLLPLQLFEVQRAHCWTALFRTGILAGIPRYEESELEGLKIKFDLMTTLAVTALARLSQAVSLVYDHKAHTGWLVPQINLLLHLCYVYYARMSITSDQPDLVPWAEPSTDGASAAPRALRSFGDIVVTEVGNRTDDRLLLRQLLVNLNGNLEITHNTKQPPKKILHWTTEIYFSKLQDQICEPDAGSALRGLSLSD
jgi:hypothetical protein